MVGIRELRDNLSSHLDEVRHGRTVTITDRGKAIARIVPIEGPSSLERLIEEGRVTPARRRRHPAPDPVAADGSVSELVEEQRR